MNAIKAPADDMQPKSREEQIAYLTEKKARLERCIREIDIVLERLKGETA